jgi:thiamine-phosphate pyrophosphorylase
MALGRRFDPRLYLVTDRGLSRGRPIESVVEAAVRGGVTAVQLREKACPAAEFLGLAIRLKSRLDEAGVPLIINDAVDIAAESRAAGVHLGQGDMSAAEARRILGPDAIIGLSVETLGQADVAAGEDIDYLGVSPVFLTPTKTNTGGAWGLDGLRRLSIRTRKPLIAIGGINASNAASVIEAGADGLAVVSAIVSAFDPESAARELRTIVDRALFARPRGRSPRPRRSSPLTARRKGC